VDTSFNRITVDGDTSTNDTVLLLANGASGAPFLEAGSQGSGQFEASLTKVCRGLARMIVEDGEGATKCVEITVSGARNVKDAESVARTISNSPLVKTAIYGQDPNWGRIVAAAGRAGVPVEWEKMALFFDGEQLVEKGCYLGKAAEAACARVMEQPAFSIRLDLGMGESSFSMLTCDFSVEYVHINADYRT
jgi:glutamate N-acetyltransferase/amino-acid N-acetyltransferase